MKKKIIKYWLLVIFSCLFLAYISINSFNYNTYIETYESNKKMCMEYLNLSDSDRDKYDKEYPGLYTISECNYIVNTNQKNVSFFFVYDKIFDSIIIKFVFPLFVPIVLLYPVIYRLSSELNSCFIKYYLLRRKYRDYIFHLIKTAYKNIMPILIIVLIFILGAAIKSDFNFNPKLDIYSKFIDDTSLLFYNDNINYIRYFAIIILNLLFYVNIGLIVLRNNNKNTIISFIESFLIIYIWWCFTFIVLGKFLNNNFGIMQEQINIMEIYRWHGILDGKIYLIINAIYYIISFAIVLLLYRNKEKLIMKCED